MPNISRASLLVAMQFLFSFTVNAGTLTEGNLASWMGTYTYEDNGGKTTGGESATVEYEIRISSSNKNLIAQIHEEGFQTDESILASVQTGSGKLILTFKSYADGKLKNKFDVAVYKVGEELLRIKREANGKATAIWNHLKPNSNPKESPLSYSR